MDNLQLTYTTLVAGAIFGCILLYSISSARKSKLPPGPHRLPLIGNVHQMPTEEPWKVFSEWGKTYGEPSWKSLPVRTHWDEHNLQGT